MNDRQSSSNGTKALNRNKKEFSSSSSGGSVGCFRCGRLGLIKAECPMAKKERAFQATWSDSDDSESDSDQAEQALMAVTSGEGSSSSEICSKYRYLCTHKVDYLRTQHILRRIGWSRCVSMPGNGSGGGFNISRMDADIVDDLATQAELKLRVWCDYSEASDYERSPDHPF
ncbi:hypothetical protein LINPERPRIM_LOCUS2512 [Linum perenne]